MKQRSDVDAVESANTALYDAFETGDIDLMGALWFDEDSSDNSSDDIDEVICVHPGWAPLRGRGAVLRSWSMIMANTAYIQFVLTDVQVQVSGDIAVVTCGENILTSMTGAGDIGDTDDDESSRGFAGGRAVATNIFRRTGDGWRLWVHHASPVLTSPVEDG